MAKATLYVPDDLWDRVRAFGDDINLSQVFQAALKAELRRLESRQQEKVDLDAEIDIQALRQRFNKQRANLYRFGYQVGIKIAGRMSYAELRYLESVGWDPKEIHKVTDDEAFEELIELDAEGGTESERTGQALEVKEAMAAALRRVWELINEDSDRAAG